MGRLVKKKEVGDESSVLKTVIFKCQLTTDMSSNSVCEVARLATDSNAFLVASFLLVRSLVDT
uniref:Uncharacterized protein n=1 Tax=Pristionchus pacificus TaxID=54126 RepID=A0A2A6CRX9_PRIPA|eukprot:PDM80858.1 hypothetical protein PRIPAC_35861 [Pristionchus pacificus]